MPPRRLTQKQIAEALGVSHTTVSACVADGMPVSSLDKAKDWYRAHRDPTLRPEANIPELSESRSKKAHHDAALAELAHRKMAGELVEAAMVRRVATAVAAETRASLERIPDRLADRLAREREPSRVAQLLMEAIDEVLADLGRGEQRIREMLDAR
jgi:phage terminase Nu1 subunit (DNA packaging protein)